jgi:uncharacterized protein YeaO (DUF488 family)
VSIRHASIYDEPAESAGLRVLIMRYWPRGVRRERVDLWLKDAAPSAELLHAYGHEGLPWTEFERRYRAEVLEERPHVLEQLRELEREHGTLILICHERMPPAEHCHRLILQDLLAAPASSRDRSSRTDATRRSVPASAKRRGRPTERPEST